MPEIKKIKYYGDTDDPMWQVEAESLFPWLSGRGVDIGAGCRSIWPDIVRVDIDEKVNPDVLASGDKLPFKDGEFDYLTSIHSFEHFEDQVKTLKEWLRVIKTGGIIAIVHPDINHTKLQNPEIDNPGLKANPYNRHCHEHSGDSFIKMISTWTDLPFRILDYGVACACWSFYVILKKT
jgi:predicted SAM-dependent methyltransferase